MIKVRRALRRLSRTLRGIPSVGRVDWGDLRRTTPFSENFGYDRGDPVDRYYIEGYLAERSALIRGHVLEVKNGDYTKRFGGERVTASDVLDIDESNPEATIITDLNAAVELPSNQFDCIILTQTLQFIWDCRAAITDLHRSLKPGGLLLVTVPVTPPLCAAASMYWSFTPGSLSRLLQEAFGGQGVEIHTLGNVLSVTAFLYGLSAKELTDPELDRCDPSYPLIIAATARKIVD
jgi:SAM-dependent methyltransferase